MERKKIFLVLIVAFLIYPSPVTGEEIAAQEMNENQEVAQPLFENNLEVLEQSNEQTTNASNSYQESKEEREVISPIYRVHNQAYGSFEESLFPYNSQMKLNIPIYDYSQKAQYLPTVYIMIPKETRLLGGLSSLQAELDHYLMLNNNIQGGQLIASRLNDTPNGREVYQITPTKGTYVGGELQDRNVHLTVEAPDKNSNIEKIILNASKNSEIADYNILFFGYDKKNLTNVNGKNPIVDANTCGIEGDDLEFATNVSAVNRQEVYLYIQKIKDSYKLINHFTGDSIKEKSIIGDFGDVYSRVGFINTIESWGLQAKDYSKDSLVLESGDINGSELFTTEARDPEAIVEGKNYSVFVKKYGGDVEVQFVDSESQTILSKEILTGFVGQEYSTQAKELQGWILETEIPEYQNGVFTEETQVITYRYNRKDSEPVVVRYVDENNNKLAEEEIMYGKVGLDYKTQAKVIKDWEIKENPINAVGTFKEVSQEVTYVYTAKSPSPKADTEPKKELLAEKQQEAKSKEKTDNILPHTGEKNTRQVSYMHIGLMFTVASMIIFFKRLKEK